MSKAWLSVIVPAYNAKEYVVAAGTSVVNGALAASSDNRLVEILLMDDGSTDETGKVCDDFAAKFGSEKCIVKVIHQDNRGHGGAINSGVEACFGEYFMVLDADDEVFADGIKALLEDADNISADLIIGGEERWYEGSEIVEKYCVPAEFAEDVKTVDLKVVTDHWNTGLRHVFSMHNMIFNTEFYRSLNITLPEKVSFDDACYFIVAAAHAKRILLKSIMLYRYRLGDPNQSVSAENRVKRISQHEAVIDAILGEYDKIKNIGEYGFLYYRLRLSSVVTDYLVTALLRCRDRAEGRKYARLMMAKFIGKDIPKLKRNYRVLYCMNLMHMGEKQFDRLIGRK